MAMALAEAETNAVSAGRGMGGTGCAWHSSY